MADNGADREFNKNILGLRGACALSVVLLHFYNGPKDDGWFSLVSAGIPEWVDFSVISLRSAVDIFFMISGFLMVPALMRANGVVKFAENRIIRVYPTFFITTFIVLLIGPIVNYKYLSGISMQSWAYYAFMNFTILPYISIIEPANVVSWSLGFEVAFYIMVSLVFLTFRIFGRSIAIAVGIMFTALSVSTHPVVCSFITGIIIHQLREIGVNKFANLPSISLPIFLAAFLGTTEYARRSTGIAVYEAYAASFLISIFLFDLITSTADRVTSLLRLPAIQYLGTISYSLYLWHPMVMFATKRAVIWALPNASPWIKIAALALMSAAPILLVAHLSYRVIEVRLANALRSIFRGLRVDRHHVRVGAGNSR